MEVAIFCKGIGTENVLGKVLRHVTNSGGQSGKMTQRNEQACKQTL